MPRRISNRKKVHPSKKQCCSQSRITRVKKPSDLRKKRSGKLTRFLKVYKGADDYHIPLFQSVKNLSGVCRVLYPGSFYHLSASLIFEDVTYVDCNTKMTPFFEDVCVMEWIKDNKRYKQATNVKFLCQNFDESLGLEDESFDVLISLSAGLVSKTCARYLKIGGLFLAGDAHYDARFAFTNPFFTLVGVYDRERKNLDMSSEALEEHFVTRTGEVITPNQVQESVDVPKAKRSFKLKKEALFYVFKKIE